MAPLRRPHRSHLLRVIGAELPKREREQAASILDRLTGDAPHDSKFAGELTAIARDEHWSWELRRIAALALEHQFLRIDSPADLLVFFRGLGLLTRSGDQMDRTILGENYSTTEVLPFAGELRDRIARFGWIHVAIARGGVDAVAGFRDHARHECLLAFARYVFTPEEVVERICTQIRRTRGLPHMPSMNQYNLPEAVTALELLPPYERTIAELLMREPVVYWVGEQTASTINSLVEYPVGTVALVIKPPGSDVEIEIKRAGLRGERVIDCVFRKGRDANPLPELHHYYGGSMARLLRWELAESACLARMHRLAFGCEAPTSRMVNLASVTDVPTPRGGVSLVSYFGQREGYGEGFEQMRAAMRRCVPRLETVPLPMPPIDSGGFGLTGKWLAVTAPEQAILTNTTSFRLERLAKYLAPEGDRTYFDEGLSVKAQRGDARRFADMLLAETLVRYTPPEGPYRSWRSYLDAAFARPDNRGMADRNYVEAMTQLGAYFGFFAAFRVASEGESFVARNIGLRSVFRGGAWRLQVIFMDHDSVAIAGRDYANCRAEVVLNSIFLDLTHLLGGTLSRRWVPGSVAALKTIYRVNHATAGEGLLALKVACRQRYQAARRALHKDRELQKMFATRFVREVSDWDEIVRSFLRARTEHEDLGKWEGDATVILRERGWAPGRAAEAVKTVIEYELELPWFSFLWTEPGSEGVRP